MKRSIRIGALLLALVMALSAAALFTGCEEAPHTTADNNGLTVICTSFAAYSLVAPLAENYTAGGGEMVYTAQILGKPGQDMHSYEPTAQDIISLANADVVVSTGAETWLDAAIRSSGNTEVKVVSMMEVCDIPEGEHGHDHDHDHDHDHGEGSCALAGTDEHVWLSVENAIRITRAVAATLREVDPAGAALWQAREEAVCGELETLRADFAAMMESALRDTVVLADRHPFVYLFRELGIHCVAAFPGCSSETDASFETRLELIEATRELELPYIFKIDGSDGTLADTVAAETGAEVLTLQSLQVVTDYEGVTYLSAMRQNLENLRKALH